MKNCFNRYRRILKHYNPQMLATSEKILSEDFVGDENFQKIVSYVVSPVLFDYVYWIVVEAQKQDISCLYFFARDGFILYKIALLIVEKMHITLECRYLFISRFASRLPYYHIIGEDCFDFICEKRACNTIRSVIQNITLDKKQFEKIVSFLSLDTSNLDKEMTFSELTEFKNSLKNNIELKNYIFELSQRAYKDCIEYYKQEGLFEDKKFAFVDVGWRGTMQVALNRLINKSIPAFYFGLFTEKFYKKSENNLWNVYYFSSKKNFFRKLFFNNSLFEAFCSAPDGMTVGYEFINEKWKPIFVDEKNINLKKWYLKDQISLILKWVDYYLITEICKSSSIKMSEKLLKEFMFHPTEKEAELYGSYLFSDETNEENLIQLAPEYTEKDFKAVLLRLLHKSLKRKCVKSFWRYGSIARSKLDFLSKFVFRSYCYAASVWTYIKQK